MDPEIQLSEIFNIDFKIELIEKTDYIEAIKAFFKIDIIEQIEEHM